jgi:hypothetical protein
MRPVLAFLPLVAADPSTGSARGPDGASHVLWTWGWTRKEAGGNKEWIVFWSTTIPGGFRVPRRRAIPGTTTGRRVPSLASNATILQAGSSRPHW